MSRQNIYSTTSASTILNERAIQNFLSYVKTNRGFIVPSSKNQELCRVRNSSNILISDLYTKMMALGKYNSFSFMRIPLKDNAIKEVVETPYLTFDILQMRDILNSEYKELILIPELNNKIIINYTDISRANGEISDFSQFQSRIVRDFLSRSFYVSKGSAWISPTFVCYIAKVYNMTIGGQIARKFGLSPDIQMFLQILFAIYSVSKMVDNNQVSAFIKAHHKDLGLRTDSVEIEGVFSFIEDTIKRRTPDNLFDVCKIIEEYGSDQLIGTNGPRITVPVLNVMFSSWHNDSFVSFVALEYPPYFAYLILLVISNFRIGLSFSMKNLNLVKEGQNIFQKTIQSSIFLNSV